MEKETKYMIITVESYPFGWETKYYYLPVQSHFTIGHIITNKDGRQYRVIDGKTQLSFEEIDTHKYQSLE